MNDDPNKRDNQTPEDDDFSWLDDTSSDNDAIDDDNDDEMSWLTSDADPEQPSLPNSGLTGQLDWHNTGQTDNKLPGTDALGLDWIHIDEETGGVELPRTNTGLTGHLEWQQDYAEFAESSEELPAAPQPPKQGDTGDLLDWMSVPDDSDEVIPSWLADDDSEEIKPTGKRLPIGADVAQPYSPPPPTNQDPDDDDGLDFGDPDEAMERDSSLDWMQDSGIFADDAPNFQRDESNISDFNTGYLKEMGIGSKESFESNLKALFDDSNDDLGEDIDWLDNIESPSSEVSALDSEEIEEPTFENPESNDLGDIFSGIAAGIDDETQNIVGWDDPFEEQDVRKVISDDIDSILEAADMGWEDSEDIGMDTNYFESLGIGGLPSQKSQDNDEFDEFDEVDSDFYDDLDLEETSDKIDTDSPLNTDFFKSLVGDADQEPESADISNAMEDFAWDADFDDLESEPDWLSDIEEAEVEKATASSLDNLINEDDFADIFDDLEDNQFYDDAIEQSDDMEDLDALLAGIPDDDEDLLDFKPKTDSLDSSGKYTGFLRNMQDDEDTDYFLDEEDEIGAGEFADRVSLQADHGDEPLSLREAGDDLEFIGESPDWMNDLSNEDQQQSAAALLRARYTDQSLDELSERAQSLHERGLGLVNDITDQSEASKVLPGIKNSLTPFEFDVDTDEVARYDEIQLSDTQKQQADYLASIVGVDTTASTLGTHLETPVSEGLFDDIALDKPRKPRRKPVQRSLPTLLRDPIRLLIAIVLLICLSVPFFMDFKIGLAAPLTFEAGSSQALAFEAIDQLQAGDRVLIGIEYGATGIGELDLLSESIFHHIIAKGAIPIILSSYPTGLLHSDQILQEIGYQANQDYFITGYLAGQEIGIQSIVRNLASLTDFNLQGEATQLKLTSLKDVDSVVLIVENAESFRAWAEQLAPYYDGALVIASTYAASPLVQAYLGTHTIGNQLLVGYQDGLTYRNLLAAKGFVAPIRPEDLESDQPEAITDPLLTDATPEPALIIEATETLIPATATAEPRNFVVITANNTVNIRESGNANAAVIAFAQPGDRFLMLAVSDDQAWVQIELPDGKIGWVALSVARIESESAKNPKAWDFSAHQQDTLMAKSVAYQPGDPDLLPTSVSQQSERWYAQTLALIATIIIILVGNLVAFLRWLARRRE